MESHFVNFLDKKTIQKLKVLGFKTLDDILEFYPHKYITQIKIKNIKDIKDEDINNIVIITGEIKNYNIKKNVNKEYLQADLYDQYNNVIKLFWFKKIEKIKKWLQHSSICTFKSKLCKHNHSYYFIHPQKTKNEDNMQTVIAQYPTIQINNKRVNCNAFLHHIISDILSKVTIDEILPPQIINKYKLMPRNEAIKNIHLPATKQKLFLAQRRLKFEELFILHLKILQSKHEKECNNNGPIFIKTALSQHFANNILPFPLTQGQKTVIEEILNNCNSGKQMNRLLQGDVGCGKTIVAFMIMLTSYENNFQSVLMTPTEILAEQHFKTLKPFCDKMDITISLLTSSTKQKQKNDILEQLQNGEMNIIISTHSILNDKIIFKNLGLIIIDEQHKFGVRQRATLLNNNHTTFHPHILLMTATPIPRTLALTLYNNYDISTINELPLNRQKVKTVHFYEGQKNQIFNFIKKQIYSGEQVFFVYPLIEESKKLKLHNIYDGYEEIRHYFPDIQIGLIHGDMEQNIREEEIEKFKNGETKILIATTVIEVGIDIPAASIMVIENAEHFGLSQLHQLRGRIGRGDKPSFCFLITGLKLTQKQKIKMNAMVKISNGFELANIDLQIRGSGNIFGEEQSGNIKLKIANLETDNKMFTYIKTETNEIIKSLHQYPLLENKIKNNIEISLGNVG